MTAKQKSASTYDALGEGTVSEREAARAALTVKHYAKDEEDLATLLDMLGLAA